MGLISTTLRAFLGGNTLALRGTLCEWQHASRLSQASKQAETQQRPHHPSLSHIWSKAPTMKDTLFLHLILPTTRLHLVWLSPISASPTYRPKRVMTTFSNSQSGMKSKDRSSAALATCFTAVTVAGSTTAEVVLLTLCLLFRYRVCRFVDVVWNHGCRAYPWLIAFGFVCRLSLDASYLFFSSPPPHSLVFFFLYPAVLCPHSFFTTVI